MVNGWLKRSSLLFRKDRDIDLIKYGGVGIFIRLRFEVKPLSPLGRSCRD